MIALLCFFELFQVRLQIFFVEPCGTVDALQLATGRIALPVGTRDAGDLERFNLARVWNVRTAAEIQEFALTIKAERRMLGEARTNMFCLQCLLQITAELNRFLA